MTFQNIVFIFQHFSFQFLKMTYSFYNEENHPYFIKIKKHPQKFLTIPSVENDICLNHAKLAPVDTHMAVGEKWEWSRNPEHWGWRRLVQLTALELARIGGLAATLLSWQGSLQRLLPTTFFPFSHSTHPTQLFPLSPLIHSLFCKFLRALHCQQLREPPDPEGIKGRVLRKLYM